MSIVTPQIAQAARASGKGLYAFVGEDMGITGSNEQYRVVNAIGEELAKIDHPEFEVLAQKLRDMGHTVALEYVGDSRVEISALNLRPNTRTTFGSYGVGLGGKYLGRVIISLHRMHIEYEGWDGKLRARRGSRKHHTSNWALAAKQILWDARMPTEEDYATHEKRVQAQHDQHAERNRRWALEDLIAENGKRAFAILLEANVVIPDDFKDVMNRYLDLTEEFGK
jgi:hypothetical protein